MGREPRGFRLCRHGGVILLGPRRPQPASEVRSVGERTMKTRFPPSKSRSLANCMSAHE
ncbi:Hypothetical protein A7982_09759 [Minicystis rosea]|nr:Hypothetical protein A7982_09759 [Minicystis rosea]